MNTKIITAFLLIISITSILSSDKLDDSYNQMLKAYAGLNSWQAVINQTNYFAQTKTKLVSAGNFYYQKNRAAIRYTKPSEQALLIQNGKVTVYDKASKTAVRTQLDSAVQSLNPVEIVQTFWKKSEKQLQPNDKGVTNLLLKPKKDDQIKEISVFLDDKTGYVTKLIYTDKQGNSVTVAFSKMKVNKPIAEAVWKLDLPKDVKVIER
ncbi:MAG: outer membrane lipoprotein carrier protein LolA [Candidatus Cloacimonetes bacterium]|nr:outer membrane lipoprotein carrier protein LolA [Candidatus Cloacimonadota bacterium]